MRIYLVGMNPVSPFNSESFETFRRRNLCGSLVIGREYFLPEEPGAIGPGFSGSCW